MIGLKSIFFSINIINKTDVCKIHVLLIEIHFIVVANTHDMPTDNIHGW